MSTCISRHGEYSDHEAGDWCPRCGAFNESAIVAERNVLRALVDEVLAACDKADASPEDGLRKVHTATIRQTVQKHLGLDPGGSDRG